MPQEKAEVRASILNKFVKLPQISYRPVQVREKTWAVGQYYEEELSGIVH